MLSLSEIEKRVDDSYELPNNVLEIIPKPMVTIRTSTYQHVSYIKDCIEGVLMQKTNFPIEYIIGEDFSTDGTREIVFDYAKKYPEVIRVLTADYNVGRNANGKRCIKAARGKYMAMCEGDDYWTDPYKLQKQVDKIHGNSNIAVVTHKTKIIRENVEYVDIFKIDWKKSTFSSIDYVEYQFFHTSSYLFKREYIKGLTIPPNIMSGDIPLMMFLLSDNRKGVMIDEVMSVYRRNPYGITHSKDRKRNKLLKMYGMWSFIRSFNLDRKTKKKIDTQLGNFARSIIRQTYKSNVRKAIYFFLMSLYHDPVIYLKKIKNKIYG